MKKSLFQRIVCFLLSFATLFSLIAVSALAGPYKPDSTAATLEEMQDLVSSTGYSEYASVELAGGKPGASVIVVDNSTAKIILNGKEYNAEKVKDSKECIDSRQENPDAWASFGDDAEDAIYLPAVGDIYWTVPLTPEQAGIYNIRITYYNCITSESSISPIERKLYINNKVPFNEAGNMVFTKYWNCETLVSQDTEKNVDEPDSYNVDYYLVDKGELDDRGYFKEVVEVKNKTKTTTKYKISQDINGNSMAPNITQTSKWAVYYCQDSTGYYQDYFQFKFGDGDQFIKLGAKREPMIVKSIELVPVNDEKAEIPSYTDYRDDFEKKGYTAADGEMTIIQAEFPDFVSDSAVSSTNDNTSAATYPAKTNAQLYNVIGENSYNTVGQWAAYKFVVSKSGLYKLGMRYKQDALQGMYICRTIKLSGGDYGLPDGTPTAPFAEAYNAQFDYNKKWQSAFVGDYVYYDANGDEMSIAGLRVNSEGKYVDSEGKEVEVKREARDFEFYFEEGVEYTVYLECSLGTLKDLIRRVEDSLETINSCYLKILQLTGNDPDEYTDYNFVNIMPEVLISLLEEAIELEAVKMEFEALCGTTGSHITTLHTIALLLDKMGSENGDEIAANMATLKSYLGTLGTWINNSKRSRMIVDCITVCPAGIEENKLPRGEANFFQSIGFEIASFFFSFFTEYDQMGLTTIPDEDTRTIDVWLATGRDQSQIWRTMIDAQGSFTDSTGVAVTLKLVTGGTLLPSILSGKGPDVYIGLGSSDVINYAIRNAVYGVSGNYAPFNDKGNENYGANDYFSSKYYTYCEVVDGKKVYSEPTKEYKGEEGLSHVSLPFNEVVDGNFVDKAMDTVRLQGITYGIPQSMSFAMMFYRMDVLAELEQEVPETWSDLLSLLPVFQTNNMSIGVTYGSAINFMLYQMGGNMWKYPDDPDFAGIEVDLDSDIALEAFDYVCRLYSDYSFPVTFDAANRFRTGEMPIIIGDYATIYNQLVVYATEIAGMWEFTSLPGYVDSNGKTNFDSLAGVGATVLLNGCEDILAAWQFIQWQTGEKVQGEYGNKMVALIGPSAKYESANIHALKNMSWTASEYEAIKLQMDNLSSIVNYPGSYIIERYTKFAFLAAVNDGADATTALTGYVDAINEEIARKRAEFNLPVFDFKGQTIDEYKAAHPEKFKDNK